jgi:predicted RNA-binding protein with TRAM domain
MRPAESVRAGVRYEFPVQQVHTEGHGIGKATYRVGVTFGGAGGVVFMPQVAEVGDEFSEPPRRWFMLEAVTEHHQGIT